MHYMTDETKNLEAQLRAYEVLTPELMTRMGYRFRNSRVYDTYGMMPDGTFRCQKCCPDCHEVAVKEMDKEGRVAHIWLRLPDFCPYRVLGLETEEVIDMTKDRNDR